MDNFPLSAPPSAAYNPFKPGPAVRLRKGLSGLHEGWKMGVKGGGLMNTAMIAFQVANAERGEAVPALATGIISIGTYGALTAVITAGLLMVPGVNVGVASFLALGLAMPPEMMLESKMMSGFKYMTKVGNTTKRLEMGGDYKDTDTATSYRHQALMEMSGAFQPSRRYLGQEARLLHR